MNGSPSVSEDGQIARRNRNTASALTGTLYLLEGLVLVAIWSLVPLASAHAYVDPSVMTYTIQAVAGLAVALSAVLGVVFRRTRRKIYELLNIDESANKFTEGDIARIDPQSPDAAQRYAAAADQGASLASACDELAHARERDLSTPARFGFAFLMCICMAFMVVIAPALEIFGSNTDSLVFSLSAVWWIPFVFCIPIAALVALLLSRLKKKAFYRALIAVFALTVAAYVQSLFMNQGMMPADGGFIGWGDFFFVSKMIVSGIVWIAIVAGLIFASRFHPHTWLKATSGIACALMIVQAVGVVSVAVGESGEEAGNLTRPYVTQGSLLSVSPKSNVVVFVLDTYDTAILDDVLRDDPAFLDSFEDFTFFHNSLGTMIPTTNAIPYMLTANKPAPGQDIAEYRRTKYEKSTFVDDICSLGYSAGIYTDSLMMDYGIEADRRIAAETKNIHPVSKAPIDVLQTFIAMGQCALYREAPWALKPAFWYYTSDINNRMIADGEGTDLNDALYELDDARILDMLRKHGLSDDDDASTGAFRFIHLFGPHFPFSMDENGNNIGTNQSDQTRQAKGSMLVVAEYIDQLKKLGLYDEATIIVTADHGVWRLTEDPVSEPISPIMLAKPSFEHASDSERQPLQRSEAPISHDDLFATVIAGMHGNASAYGSTLFEISDPARIRYFDALTSAGGNGQHFVEYAVNGDALNLANWQKTGNTWQDA